MEKETVKSISVPLTDEQNSDLQRIREEFDLYQLNTALDEVYTYASDDDEGISDMYPYNVNLHYKLSKVRQLVAILMQPGIEI